MRAGVACLLLAVAASLLACGGQEQVPPPPTDFPPAPAATEWPTSATYSSVPTLDPQPEANTPYPTPGLTIGPATYIDPVFGYSYEVPSGWFVLQTGGGYSALTSYDPSTAPQHGFGCDEQTGVIKVEFYVDENAERLTLEQWLAQGERNVSVLEESETSVDGVTGIRRIRSFDADTIVDSDQYYFEVGGRIYAIIAYCFDPSLGILSVVLPTVRFNG
jgi:hypothetical protein